MCTIPDVTKTTMGIKPNRQGGLMSSELGKSLKMVQLILGGHVALTSGCLFSPLDPGRVTTMNMMPLKIV